MKFTARFILPKVLKALHNSPILFINGIRQSGKSTLVHHISLTQHPTDYITLDNPLQMPANAREPIAFIKSRKRPIIIDEVQLVPELFRALKIVVDDVRLKNNANINGKFLLTKSANILALPKLSDALVVKIHVLTLYPFSAAEKIGGTGESIDRLFNQDFSGAIGRDLRVSEAIELSTFPEITSKSQAQKTLWLDSYINTLLQREVCT